MVNPETTATPIYCPRRQQHGAVCETPNACAGGADCRLGPDLEQHMKDWAAASRTTIAALAVLVVVTHGVIRYENIPPGSEAAVACCVSGVRGDGSCIKSGEAARAYQEGSISYAE